MYFDDLSDEVTALLDEYYDLFGTYLPLMQYAGTEEMQKKDLKKCIKEKKKYVIDEIPGVYD